MRSFAEDLKLARGARGRQMRELRRAGATRRGLSDEFYRLAADAISGKEHPVKALAEMQQVDISTASRWLSSARTRGFIV
jgi:DNA-binding MarR family transcriptional regulator